MCKLTSWTHRMMRALVMQRPKDLSSIDTSPHDPRGANDPIRSANGAAYRSPGQRPGICEYTTTFYGGALKGRPNSRNLRSDPDAQFHTCRSLYWTLCLVRAERLRHGDEGASGVSSPFQGFHINPSSDTQGVALGCDRSHLWCFRSGHVVASGCVVVSLKSHTPPGTPCG